MKWSFIKNVLGEMKIPRFIMYCVTSVKSNVHWKGSQNEYFKPKRGLKEDDPMSPYLFVLYLGKKNA